MSIAPNERRAPQFTAAHRLALAREVAKVTRKEMADILGVTPQSISNYENGKSAPSKLQINAWAVACGVDVEWLKTGKAQEDGGPRGGEGQLSDYKATVVTLPGAVRRAA